MKTFLFGNVSAVENSGSGKRRQTTILDVAERADVSISTVSRVINGVSNVREKTRLRVLRAIVELGFEPNAAARSLRSHRTNAIGLVLPDIGDPFYGQLARAIQAEASQRHLHLVTFSTEDDPGKGEEFLASVKQHRLDGIIVATLERDDSRLLALAEEGACVIALGGSAAGVPSVFVDNIRAAREATSHLVQLGHSRVAFLAGPLRRRDFCDRMAGYRRALVEEGLDVCDDLLWTEEVPAANLVEWGWLVVSTRLEARDAATAIVAGNDALAMGALRAIGATGRRVPDDVAVVGFDDVYLARYLNPPLTTVAQPIADMAAESVGMLVELLEAGEVSRERIVLQTELQVRQSCGAFLIR
jgi:DNA-binding LacI/PurR family transcriptional regulator